MQQYVSQMSQPVNNREEAEEESMTPLVNELE